MDLIKPSVLTPPSQAGKDFGGLEQSTAAEDNPRLSVLRELSVGEYFSIYISVWLFSQKIHGPLFPRYTDAFKLFLHCSLKEAEEASKDRDHVVAKHG